MRTCTVLFIVMTLVFSCGAGCSNRGQTPQQAFELAKKYVLRNDWHGYWNMMSQASRESFDKQVAFMQDHYGKLPETMQQRMLESMQMTEEDMRNLDGRSFFVSMQEQRDDIPGSRSQYTRDLFASAKVIKTEIDNDRALLYIEDEAGHMVKLPLVREQDVWKLDLTQFYSF